MPNPSVFLGAEPLAASSSGAKSEATEECSAHEGRVFEILALLREQALFWVLWDRRSRPGAFFVSNHNEPIFVAKPQVLRCLLCHSDALGADILALKTRGRKGLITYNKAHGTNAIRKHVEHEHGEVSSRFYRDIVECSLKPAVLSDRQPAKKCERVTPGAISAFFGSTKCVKNNDEHQKAFLEDIVLLIAKRYYPLSSVENMWFRQFALCRDPRVVFPSCKSLTEDVLLAMVEHTLETIV